METSTKTKLFPSIESLYPRNRETNILSIGDNLRDSTWGCIREWELTEKIDGMNFSFFITSDGIECRGRTANAQFKVSQIEAALASIPSHEDFVEYFVMEPESLPITVFGELYGQGIQKGSGHTGPVRFRAFDIQIGRIFESGHVFRVISEALGIPTVPYLGLWDLEEPIDYGKLYDIMPESLTAIEDTGTHAVVPEGVVARPRDVLYDAYGNRIWWKITNRDLIKARGLTNGF